MWLVVFSFFLLVTIHLVVIALTARLLGVQVTELSIGYGPQIISLKNVSIKPLIIGGLVRMFDTRSYEFEEGDIVKAYDRKNSFVRAIIPLSGSLALLLIGFFIFGLETTNHFINGFFQIFQGTMNPTSSAIDILSGIEVYFAENDTLTIFGMLAIKLAALNLFPLPHLNGGAALLELSSLPEKVKEIIYRLGGVASLGVIISWLFALSTFLF